MKKSKKIISLLLSLILTLSVFNIIPFTAGAVTYENTKLYFDVSGTGWEMGEKDKVGFYIHSVAEGEELPWGGKKLNGVNEGDGIWSYDPAAKGMTINDGVQYQVIFTGAGQQTADLFFDTTCFGHCAYCNGEMIENTVDSSKKNQVALWKDLNPTEYGPVKGTTSLGNLVGTCLPQGETDESLFTTWLTDEGATGYANAMKYTVQSGTKTEQQLIDDLAGALELTKEFVEQAIAESGIESAWKAADSTLPATEVPETTATEPSTEPMSEAETEAPCNTVASGTTGDCTWTVDNGVLTISGNGKMGDYYYDLTTDYPFDDPTFSFDSLTPWNNNSFTEVVIVNGVTSIGAWAFDNCTGLKSVTIPDSVTSIREGAFAHCWSLTNVTIPDSVKYIGDGAFYWSGLTSVTIGNSVTSVGYYAFDGCLELKSVTIPDSVTSIGSYAFSGTGLTSIDIPDSVTSIGEGAFSSTSLTSVTIPDSVTSIGDSAFYYCENLTSVTLSQCAVNRFKNIFNNYKKIENIVLTDSVTSIGSAAFSGTGLTSIDIPDSVTSIGEGAFSGTGLTSIDIPDSVTSIGRGAFSGCKELTSVTIPDSVTSIGRGAFSGCTGLTSIDIPDSVTSIGERAFSGTGLKSVTIPDSVTSIGDQAFAECTGLKSVTIPDSVTSIGYRAFYKCTGLKSVTIPDSVTSIGEKAFGYYYNSGYKKISGFKIYGYKDTEAEKYANNNGFTFKAIIGKCDNCRSALFEYDYHSGYPATCAKDGLSDGYICPSCGHKSQTVIPATGHHTPGEPVQENVVPATCQAAGSYDEVVYCTECKAEISRESKTIEKLPHTPVTDKAVPATCAKTGLTEGSHCSVCNTVLVEQTVVPIIPHTPGKPKQENLIKSTCTKEGSYDEVTYCTVCKAEISRESKTIEKLPHTPVTDKAVPATCTKTGLTEGSHCSVCNTVLVEQTVIPVIDHTPGEPVQENVVPATCTAQGSYDEVVYCSVCKAELSRESKTIDMLAHTPATDKAVPATCTKTGLTEGSHCSVCKTVLVEQTVIPALGHKPIIDKAVEATCQHDGHTIGSYCENCGEVYVQSQVIPKLPHTPVKDEAVAATCTHTGLTEGYHCSECNEILTAQEITKALGHTYEAVPGKPATYLHTGLTDGVKCSRCGEWLIEQEVIPKLTGEGILGDIDGDGEASVLDATYIQRYATRVKVPFTDEQMLIGDVDDDGELTVLDATYIQRYSTRVKVPYPIGQTI